MDLKTQRRGPADTTSGRFAKLLAVSVLLHVPFTPWAALIGLLGLWSPPPDDVESPPITAIPIDVLEDPEPSAPSHPEAPAVSTDQTGPAEPVAQRPKKPPEPAAVREAGARDAEADASPADAEAAQVDAGPKVAGARESASADAGPASDAGARPLSDPALVGAVKQIADPNALVRVFIYTAKIRENPLGARIGPLLRSLYQWRDFLGPTAIDPIRDFDQILVTGSQLRDSRNVAVIIAHHLPPARIRAAIDALVRADHDGGEWLDAGVPAASAHADGGERRYLLSNAQTVMVVPPSAYAAALAAGKFVHLPPSAGPEVALIYLATPWRAFIGWPIQVPHSIKWARIRVTPTVYGGATAELEAEDESAALARDDADYLTRSSNALAQLDLGLLGSLLGAQTHRFVEGVSFSAEGNKIHGNAQVSAAQLSTLLDFGQAFLSDRDARHARVPAAPSASSAHAGQR